MKPLTLKDLSHNEALEVFELGYLAGRCKNPGEFRPVLDKLVSVLPITHIVCGFGKNNKPLNLPTDTSKANGKKPIQILKVFNYNWPLGFLKHFLNADLINRDSHFIDAVLTQEPKTFADLYDKNKTPFNKKTGKGFDRDYVEIFFDYNVPFTTRQGLINPDRTVTNYSFCFPSAGDASRYKDFLKGIFPFMHEAFLRCFQLQAGRPLLFEKLTSRQKEILKWIGEGKTNWEIGMILHLSERTIKYHVQNLMIKFDANNRHHLIAKASVMALKIEH